MRTSTLLVAARRVAPYLLCAIGLLVLVAGAVAFIGSPGYGYDYSAYDAAARRIASGQPLYLPGTAEAYNAGRYAVSTCTPRRGAALLAGRGRWWGLAAAVAQPAATATRTGGRTAATPAS